MPFYKDLTGRRFGKLVVQRLLPERTKSGKAIWECKCDCGNTANVISGNLLSGLSTTCGCSNRLPDLTGQRFGKLVVLRKIDKRIDGKVSYECLCDCGSHVNLPASRLVSGNTTSCGCKQRVANHVYTIDDVGICIVGDWDSYFWFDLCDLDLVLSRTWRVSRKGYVVANAGATTTYFHRAATSAPDDFVVDHANGDTRDNRRCNLRICTTAENVVHKTSGVKGYIKGYKGKYAARAVVGGQHHNLGQHNTPEDAHSAYIDFMRGRFGEFAPHDRVIYYPGYDNGRD